MFRRQFLTSCFASTLSASFYPGDCFAQRTVSGIRVTPEDQIAWFDVQQWGVEGKGWSQTKKYYDRLPAKAESKVRAAVWGLSRHSAGMLARFKTNSKTLHVRYSLSSDRIAMSHMPATGVSGVDLYAENGQGQMQWVNVSRPTSNKFNGILA
ncbi:MAG: SGNH/GDSL hydrolase N-terminal domain-containing protein, partial [Planctomycetota bacterium]|nr:SGNH/GDSL hydrolase N-terminal domain-containing protein [Planctomycetota bacterium]